MENFIRIEELYDSQARRNREKHKLYETFFTSCTTKIKKSASVFKQYTCTYDIPPFKIGHPQYNPVDLRNYIVKRLRLNGFFVKYDTSNMLFISWKPEDFNYNNYCKYMNYLNNKYDKEMDQKLIDVANSSKKNNKDPDIGLITYGNEINNDIVPVNLKKLEKIRL